MRNMTRTDSANHVFTEVGNIRITYIPARDREEAKNWAGSDVLRLQSYRGEDGSSLHKGAELPVPNAEVFVELISALCMTYNEGRKGDTA
jgi:hypothetical protein